MRRRPAFRSPFPGKHINKNMNYDNRMADPASRRLAASVAPFEGEVMRAGGLSVVAALLWVVMAAAVANIFGALIEDRSTPASLALAVTVFVAAGALRIALEWRATDLLDIVADRLVARERRTLVEAQDRLSPRASRLASASLGALLVDKLPHLAPFVRRYRPAALRVAILPGVLLLVSFSLSWTVALILLVAGPLIPLFMALVGLAAREASERQMAEIGTLSGLLAERLAALFDIRLLDARERMLAEFDHRSQRLRKKTMAVLKVAFLSSAVLELFSALGVAMVAVYAGFALLGELRFGAWATPLTATEGIFLLMIGGYQYRYELQDIASRLTAGLIPGSPISVTRTDGRLAVALERGGDGHFLARGTVNGVTVSMLIDTGATTTVLTSGDAARAGIDVGRLSFTVPIMTANGPAKAASAVVDEITIGEISRGRLTVLVASPSMLAQSLLGMNFINSLSGFDMRGDRLTLID